jgi:hypothetical protein
VHPGSGRYQQSDQRERPRQSRLRPWRLARTSHPIVFWCLSRSHSAYSSLIGRAKPALTFRL